MKKSFKLKILDYFQAVTEIIAFFLLAILIVTTVCVNFYTFQQNV